MLHSKPKRGFLLRSWLRSWRSVSAVAQRPRRVQQSLLLEALEDRQLLSTFTVTNTNDSGPGSLRQAILDANGHNGKDTIHFRIGSGTAIIQPLSPLPAITDSVNIDGSSQPGYVQGQDVMILLDGLFAGPSAEGLDIRGHGATVRALDIRNFSGDGILLEGGSNTIIDCGIGVDQSGAAAMPNHLAGIVVLSSKNTIGGNYHGNIISGNGTIGLLLSGSNNTVQGNYIGVNYNGEAAIPNGQDGVYIAGSSHNLIGGTYQGQVNIISGNTWGGVTIHDGSYNQVENNYIGTDSGGTYAIANNYGVYLSGEAQYNTIGGPVFGMGNVISGNRNHGVTITDYGSFKNVVQGNYIGLNSLGNQAVPNGADGVWIGNGATSNTIGGTKTVEANTISGNNGNGVTIVGQNTVDNSVLGNSIGTDPGDPLNNVGPTRAIANTNGVFVGEGANHNAIGNAIGNYIFGSGNTISGNKQYGVWLTDPGTSGNSVSGNYIGTNYLSNLPVPNGQTGVRVDHGASDNTIGGFDSTIRGDDNSGGNIISGNGYFGVVITGTGTDSNQVLGNHIGTGVGDYSVPNGVGVFISDGAQKNQIGLPAFGCRNIISGNWWHGIDIDGATTSFNTVQNNYIGVASDGKTALPNAQSGMAISGGANHNLIGGDLTHDLQFISGKNNDNSGYALISGGNVISGNKVNGVLLYQAFSNTVSANFIGTDASGMQPVGNGNDGVQVDAGSSQNIIGIYHNGWNANIPDGSGNVISGNSHNGIALMDGGTSTNFVQGNYIGLDRLGKAAVPNAADGVLLKDGPTANIIGGSTAEVRNIISGNLAYGVLLAGNGTNKNSVDGNYVGTDLSGATNRGNGGAGVALLQTASFNEVDTNLIAFNGGSGVQVGSGPADLCESDTIWFNDILHNLGPGISLGLNGNGVVTPGPNNGQVAPVLNYAYSDGTQTTVNGTVQGQFGSTYEVQFFINEVGDPSNVFAQGGRYVAKAEVQIDQMATNDKTGNSGIGNFTVVLPGGKAFQFVTATATDPARNTSEFSGAVQIYAGRPPQARAAGTLSQPAAYGSALIAQAASGEQGLATYTPARKEKLPLQNIVPNRAAVDAFFGSASPSYSETAFLRTAARTQLTPFVEILSDNGVST